MRCFVSAALRLCVAASLVSRLLAAVLSLLPVGRFGISQVAHKLGVALNNKTQQTHRTAVSDPLDLLWMDGMGCDGGRRLPLVVAGGDTALSTVCWSNQQVQEALQRRAQCVSTAL